MEIDIVHAFPVTCHYDSGSMCHAYKFIIKDLKKVMTNEEIMFAHEEKQPYINIMRCVTCRQCDVFECKYFFKNLQGCNSDFVRLLRSEGMERVEKGKQFLEMLISEDVKNTLQEKGITVSTSQIQSSYDTVLFIAFKIGEKYSRIKCEVGKGKIYFEFKEKPLTSINQLRRQVDIAINYLIKICGE